MSNYKIRVNSEAESKEIQINLEQLGFKKSVWGIFVHNSYFIFANCNYYSRDDIENFSECDYKEITLPELRDLVVLKRNDVRDATHEGYLGLKHLLLMHTRHVWVGGKWLISTTDFSKLKPIEKKEMKAKKYLMPSDDYKLIEAYRKEGNDWIEVPEWAVAYADHKNGYRFFYDSLDKVAAFHDIVWQRHTHPEELPFIDDEPLQSLNDQYAEIETVRQTLNQRQEQYGSFEDVAMITEQMVDVMRKGYYENLAYNQKMALYMICSKMARIVNGNPNHKDSWHDIAGYATLIDNELVSEKDMPF